MFKTYHEFLFESTQDTIIDKILVALEPKLDNMMARIEAWELEQFGKAMSEFSKKMTRLSLTYDLVRAIEVYTEPTDSLEFIDARTSVKGNIEIKALIKRGDKVYDFNTEAIYAGGHTIQRLHYRYITKTNLPVTRRQEATKAYADKIKKLSKAEKLNQDLASAISRKENNDALIAQNSTYTDAQILDLVRDEQTQKGFNYLDKTWDDLSPDSYAKKENTRESFEKKQEELRKEAVSFWKRKNIEWKKDYKVSHEREIKKLQSKLDAIAAGI